jgi:putative transposase
VGLHRSTLRYRSRSRGDAAGLSRRIHELAAQRPRFGYRRLHILLRREGVTVNHKRVERIYRQEGLALRRRGRKRVAAPRLGRPLPPDGPNEHWALDFVSDTVVTGRRIRVLTVIDAHTREALAIEVDTSLPGARVVRVLDRVVAERGRPRQIVLDNGPELTGKVLDQWAHQQGVTLRFIDRGKPVQNAHAESFNGRLRDECLNQHWFTGLDDARDTIAAWRDDYNTVRPHSALGNLTPLDFAERSRQPGMLSA